VYSLVIFNAIAIFNILYWMCLYGVDLYGMIVLIRASLDEAFIIQYFNWFAV